MMSNRSSAEFSSSGTPLNIKVATITSVEFRHGIVHLTALYRSRWGINWRRAMEV